MEIQHVSPVISMKETHLNNGGNYINYTIGEALTPKLSSLSLQAPMREMSTPPALATPTSQTPEPVIPTIVLPPGLVTKPILKEDTGRVIDFLRKNFFRDEPLNMAVGLLENDEDTCVELEEYCTKSIEEELSTIIENEEKNIIGVVLNGLHCRDDEIIDDTDECGNEKFRKILKLLYKVNHESCIFKKCTDLDQVLDLKILSVDSAYRGQGLGHFLLQKTIETAKSINMKAIRSECSSIFTAKVMMKMGAKKIYGLKYDDYKDSNGDIIFNVADPHVEMGIYYFRL